MRKMNNKGVSMVEVLIALAIFTILMMPIVHGIVTSMTRTTDAKTLQYRNEYVENVVEYIKQDSIENIISGSYFSTLGSYTDTGKPVVGNAVFRGDPTDKSGDANVTYMKDVAKKSGLFVYDTDNTEFVGINNDTGLDEYYPYEEYMLMGKVKLGTEHETYSYKVQISNKYYAEKQQEANDDSEVYVNPNNLALGVVEDIDHTKVALINGTIANYDQTVSNAFLTKKIEILKEKDPTWYEVYTQQQLPNTTLFESDKATRIITVKVSGAPDKGYTVRCSLKYHDDGQSKSVVADELANYNIEYVPFEFNYPVDPATKVATLPNIYLMYNVCMYNGQFSDHDYIAFDTTELDATTNVNCFIVETAETYSSKMVGANPDLGVKQADNSIVTPKLYNDNKATDTERSDVRIHIAATKGSKLKNLHVYHNFDITVNSDKNKKNGTIYYSSGHSNLFDSTFSSTDYIGLVNSSGESVAAFKPLDAAEQESRGLYEIKVWMVKGDDLNKVDTTKKPIMTATKGGDES